MALIHINLDLIDSEEGRQILHELNLSELEKAYFKYCFLGNITGATVILGVGSASVVNILTSALGIQYTSCLHLGTYILCMLCSIIVFLSVIRLYSYCSDSLQLVEIKGGTKGERDTGQLEYYQKNREVIRKHLNRTVLFSILFVLLGIATCVLNQGGPKC